MIQLLQYSLKVTICLAPAACGGEWSDSDRAAPTDSEIEGSNPDTSTSVVTTPPEDAAPQPAPGPVDNPNPGSGEQNLLTVKCAGRHTPPSIGPDLFDERVNFQIFDRRFS